MSTNKTENYGLHAWVAGDDFLREEINENFALLDGAGRMGTGQYVGSAQSQDTTLQVIQLPVAPTAVFCSGNPGYFTYSDSPWGFFLMQGQTMDRGATVIGRLSGSTLEVGNKINSGFLNLSGTTYTYILFY